MMEQSEATWFWVVQINRVRARRLDRDMGLPERRTGSGAERLNKREMHTWRGEEGLRSRVLLCLSPCLCFPPLAGPLAVLFSYLFGLPASRPQRRASVANSRRPCGCFEGIRRFLTRGHSRVSAFYGTSSYEGAPTLELPTYRTQCRGVHVTFVR